LGKSSYVSFLLQSCPVLFAALCGFVMFSVPLSEQMEGSQAA
jgi:hypothetical protein